ncbi:UNVERIFIED_CONTAM: Brassinosteroid-related acyltransferase 1 [Sesamum radiatum]|uniref:Brassinosteroid-related acyltransferase 1 n=1 Tax=Sesamum radiatum TaxID=300843 RepID=A0AAW2TSR2_SESRA
MAVYPPVSITKSISVHPCKVLLHPHKTLLLSNLDRQCPTLMYMVFFYKSTHQDLCSDSVFSRLKTGLEATLSVWYPAAGRLSFSCPHHEGKLNIWCNNAGALLVQAVTQAKIPDLGDLSIYNDFFEN